MANKDNHSNLSLSQLGEFGLIRKLSEILAPTLKTGLSGIGNDCAVLDNGIIANSSLVLSTDTMVEGRHFSWDYTTAFELGWKLLAVNLSDIAAGGGRPIAALVSLQLRPAMSQVLIEELYRGIAALALKYNVSIVGGDTTSSDRVAFNVTALGLSNAPSTRAGAQLGDELWVTGTIGAAGLGLGIARKEFEQSETTEIQEFCRKAYCKPSPPLSLGSELANQKLISAMMDVSDGLIQDAGHLARQSQKGVELLIDKVPVPNFNNSKWSILRACVSGDDYELLFSTSPDNREEIQKLASGLGIPVTVIGRVTEVRDSFGPSVYLTNSQGEFSKPARLMLEEEGLPPDGGFRHF